MAIEESILRLVLYFDVFGHPLTEGELIRLIAPDAAHSVLRAIGRLVERGRVNRQARFVYAPGRPEGVSRRVDGQARCEAQWRTVRRSAGILARFPWVRGVFLTGGMSKGVSHGDADIDFLLVIEPGRVWVAKSTLHTWRRCLPGPVRECFCTNYLIAEDQLLIDEQNMFIAIELATAVPLHGPGAARALLARNPWAQRFVPGWDWCLERADHTPPLPRRRAARVVERVTAPAAPHLDRQALAAFDALWNRKYAWLDPETRGKRFKRRPDVATNHLNDHQATVLEAWHARLELHGVPPP